MTNTAEQSATQDSETNTGLYLYCIIRKTDHEELSDIKGLGEKDLRVVGYKDLEAVVSDVSGTKQQANRDNLLKHASVLDQILQKKQLLPFRFGLIADSDDEIINNLIKPHHDEFDSLLSKLEGKKELGLKIYWNEKAVLDDIVQKDETIRHLRDQLMGKPDDASTHQDKIELGRRVEHAVEERRSELKDEALQALTPLAEEHKENKILSDNMILNAAFLVQEKEEQEFGQKLKALDEKHHGFLIFRYVPEAPPYNFVSINLSPEAAQR